MVIWECICSLFTLHSIIEMNCGHTLIQVTYSYLKFASITKNML